ncbi:MAG: 30S ribosomal protein S2 [Erysipelotrichaceae bacterium]|jgi:small subunit ribosomal protein S2|nr:30S ribosomal protein S2 [Erysipelotrichaceae bacterium]
MSEEKLDETIESVTNSSNKPIVTIKQLLEAGAHYGHPTRRWNPSMKEYIYSAEKGYHIINLQKTRAKIIEAYDALSDIVQKGGKVLFVGTKKYASTKIKEEATRCGFFFVTNRWLGGTLTNLKTIQNRVRYFNQMETKKETGYINTISKKEQAAFKKEYERLEKNFEGLKQFMRLPQAIVIIDTVKENIALKEAKKSGIPVFATANTSANPDLIDYVIPMNDDSEKSINLIISLLVDTIAESQSMPTSVAHVDEVSGDTITMEEVIVEYRKQREREKIKKQKEAREAREAREAMLLKKYGPRKPRGMKTEDAPKEEGEEETVVEEVEEGKGE